MFLMSYGKNNSKSMLLCIHLCWYENFVQVDSQWFIEVQIWILSTAYSGTKVPGDLIIKDLVLFLFSGID